MPDRAYYAAFSKVNHVLVGVPGVVVPSKSGVRASEYANYMSKVERELRVEGDDQVLLVPALED